LAERIRGLELDTWEQTTQIVRRIGIEVSWAKIADVMISSEGVESSNFVTGVSGWKIDGAGNAEFNTVTVRGTIYATGGEISGDLEIVSGGKIITRSGSDDSGLTIYPSGLIEFQPGDLTAPSLSAYPNINLGSADDSVQIESGLPNSGSVSRITVGTNNAPGFSGLISMLALGVGAQILVSSNNTIGFSAKTAGGTANTAPYVFTITNNPSSADLFEVNLGATNRFKVRNDGRIMISGAFVYFNNSTGDSLGIDTAGNLIISGDIFYFNNTSEYFQISDASNFARIVQDSVETHRFASSGDIHIIGTRIVFDVIGGNDYLEMSDSLNQFKMVIGGNTEMTMGTTGFLVPNIWNSTGGTTANVQVASDGRLRQVTSALRFKRHVSDAKLEDVRLYPRQWQSKGDDSWHVGFVAEEVVKEMPMVGLWDDDGRLMNYEDRAVLAVLAAKVNRLEAELDLLKKSSSSVKKLTS
jgi:hypothetical protein